MNWTLVFNDDAFTVSDELLTKIPFFSGLITSQMKESKYHQIHLPEDDLTEVANYFRYLSNPASLSSLSFRDLCHLTILADKWLHVEIKSSLLEALLSRLNLATFSTCLEFHSSTKFSSLESSLTSFTEKHLTELDFDEFNIDNLSTLLSFSHLPSISKLYTLIAFSLRHPTDNIAPLLPEIDSDVLIQYPNSPLIASIFKKASKSNNPALAGYLFKLLAKTYSTTEKRYNEFDKVVQYESYNPSLLSFHALETKQVPNSPAIFKQIRPVYQNYPNWVLKLPSVQITFTKQEVHNELPIYTGMLKFDLQNPEHKTFLDTISSIYKQCATELENHKLTLNMRYFTANDPEATGFKNPIYVPYNHNKSEKLETNIAKIYCKVKKVSSRNLTTQLLDNRSGTELDLDSLISDKFYTLNDGVISLYVYISTTGSLCSLIVNLRKAYL